MLTEQEKLSVVTPIAKLVGEIQLECTKLELKLNKWVDDRIDKHLFIIDDAKELVNSEYNRKLAELDALKRNVSFYGDHVSRTIRQHSDTLDYDMSIGNVTTACAAYRAQLAVYQSR